MISHKPEKLSVDKTVAIFLVRCKSTIKAQSALLLAATRGFETLRFKSLRNASEQSTLSGKGSPQHSLLPWKIKDPSPKRVRRFKVLVKKLTVRKGRRLSSEIVEQKKLDEVVHVNRIRGRRARLVDEHNSNDTLGWASLFTKDGILLLEQLE